MPLTTSQITGFQPSLLITYKMQWRALALSGAYLSKKIVLLKVARTSGEKGSVFVKLERMKLPNLKSSNEKNEAKLWIFTLRMCEYEE